MTSPSPSRRPGVDERVFVRARKPLRPNYSVSEAQLGVVLLAVLAAVLGWIAWRGAHPDPALTSAGPGLVRRAAAEKADRGPLPGGLAPPGWREEKLGSFGPNDLYVKIDGREGYYKALGFERLTCVTLVGPSGKDTVDLELYDLGRAANALGAASGELPQGAAPEFKDGSLSLLDKNALYLTRGRYYLRAIGSDEGEAVRGLLERVKEQFLAALPAERLPWAYALFGGLGVAPDKVSYLAENAFSFGFAKDVEVGLLPDGETELFVAPAADAARARELARRFEKGFSDYGTPLGSVAGARWFKDKYLSRASAAVAQGRLVVGVHGAQDERTGAASLEKLRVAARALPADTDFTAPAGSGKEE